MRSALCSNKQWRANPMADGMYEVIALIPETSDFSLEVALKHFGSLKSGSTRLRAEAAVGPGKRKPSGFRVYYGDWAIVAWLEADKSVLEDSRELANRDNLPAPTEVVSTCSRRLSVWSDEDPGFDHTDEFNSFTDELRARFGVLIYDNVNGEWWT
ncbi:hypothetical protein J8F10_18805 [Gemmata sp. G18]|uniref:Uncharacterized protein n=1 Tax=Gemmata palustris TaxID=2822762 RepID=A0ABS5BUG9_9BACT|nr:hypothetical protein [Gemmata palustris]MBP3957300.1 hypothetical protein [Gemmata palustris]